MKCFALLVAAAPALAACRTSSDAAQLTLAPSNQPAAKPAAAAPPPVVAGVTPVAGDYTIKDFSFTSGEKLDELRIHYTTLGTAKRDSSGRVTNAVLIMHGTNGSGAQFFRPQFVDTMFGRGQPLDLTRYYVILPDDIGHGGSSKPSDGLKAKFPHYGYTDMVAAEHALVVDGLKVDHLRLVMGTSMGCMHSWMWATQWPQAMDGVFALACLPNQIAGRNRAWRKMVIDGITHDPTWNHGDYTQQPYGGMINAHNLLLIAGSSPQADQKKMPNRDAADRNVETELAKFLKTADANDTLYAVSSSADYDPSANLEKITAPLVLVNSGDDFINPPDLGIAEREIKRVARGKYILIPASESTHGHGTHTWGAFWGKDLKALLDATAR